MKTDISDPARRQWLGHQAAWALGTAALGGMALMGGCAGRDPAPDAAFVRLDGTTGRIADLRGKVVLVNFWATSCATCIAEMPGLIDTHQRYQARGYETLAVAMSYDPPAYVANFAERRQLPFWVAIDNTGAIARAFGDIRLTPTTFLIDKRGGIVKRYVGAPDFTALNRLVEDLVAEKG
ncbi:MAG: TlpA family protein disulfide reductase [Burkholderiaceae bacterium]|jgi:peroxiredoxin